MSDNHTPSDDFDNLFGHLIEYGKTEEFQEENRAFNERRKAFRRPYNREGQQSYRKRYPEFIKIRAEASKHKARLCAQQKGLCYLCGKPMDEDCEVDHKVALVNGGTNDIENLCAVHKSCNARKGSK